MVANGQFTTIVVSCDYSAQLARRCLTDLQQFVDRSRHVATGNDHVKALPDFFVKLLPEKSG